LINQDGTGVTLKMGRNNPFDIQAMAQVVASLAGTLDDEARLDLFPEHVISKEAKERILKAKEADKALMLENVVGDGEEPDSV
jgi:hypothetical protein